MNSFAKESLSEIVNNTPDDAPSLVENIFQNPAIARQSNLAELYSCGGLDVHLHFAYSLGELDTQDFCAIFRGLPLGVINRVRKPLSAWNRNVETDRLKLLQYDDQQAVFVDYVQLRQQPENVRLRHIGSLVRLKLLNRCKAFATDKWGNFPPHEIVELAAREIYGESGLARCVWPSPIQSSKLKDQMIESGSKIVNAVPDDHRQDWIEWLSLGMSDNDLVPLLINFAHGPNRLSVLRRTQSVMDSSVKIIEVRIRSVEL